MIPLTQKPKKLKLILLITTIVVGSTLFVLWNTKQTPETPTHYDNAKDEYTAFISESYDIIQKNYWDKITNEGLSDLFKKSTDLITKKSFTLATTTKEGVIDIVDNVFKQNKSIDKKEFVTLLVHTVLQNLQPTGRSALYTTVKEKKLRNTVANINPDKDIYGSLGLEKGATTEQVEKAYEEEKRKLEGDTSSEAEQKRTELEYAKTVLADEQKKTVYDATGQEPTVLTEIMSSNILYMRIPRLSPQTFNEFISVSEAITDEKLNSLILDLRGNIGGAIDTLQWFLGPFIGPNQYAYDFFQQGNFTPYKTQAGWLPSMVKYKRVVILIDKNSQSSAEVMVATFNKYNVGILVGEPTKGWGTVENTFPLTTKLGDNTYSLYLVHSITLRPDGQPIEGRGVDPVIYTKDSDWKKQCVHS